LIALHTDGRVARWKGEAFQESQPVMALNPVPPSGCFSPDARLQAAGSTNGIVQIWNLEHGTLIRELSAAGVVQPLAFLGHGDRLIVENADYSVREWDLLTGRETQSWQAAERTQAWAISPDDRWCVTFGSGGAVLWRDLVAGVQKDPGMTLRQPSKARFSPDGKLLAAGSWLGMGKVWSVDSQSELWTLHGFLMGIDSVAFSADVTRLAAGSGGKEAIKLWDVTSHQELLTLEAEGSTYYQTAFSPDGNTISSRNQAGVLHLWRAPSWEEIAAAETKGKREVQRP
jgi:WD40 repeat protein